MQIKDLHLLNFENRGKKKKKKTREKGILKAKKMADVDKG